MGPRLAALAAAVLPLAAAADAPARASAQPADAPSDAVEVAPGVEWARITRARGPVRINALSVDPARVRGILSNSRIAGRERVSRMARRVGAPAAVNGGYFAPNGDPVGVLAIDGRLLSEPVNGRSALVVPASAPPVTVASARERAAASQAGAPFIAPVRYRGRISVNGRSRELDGVERVRGLIPACGGQGGDRPTMRPNAVLTCTDSSELVLLTRAYGARPPLEGGVEAVLRDGLVERLRAPGSGGVPRGASLLTGSGDAADFLRNAALPRSRVDLSLELRASGRALPLDGQAVVLGGGPRLLRAGRVAVTARAEGFAPLRSFAQTFVTGRQPRTLAGVMADGRLLLVTVDGRRPGWSVGMTLPEAARLMRSLGARDALNLDGGGSTTMVIRGQVVNRPSVQGGAGGVERPVGDALYVPP